MQTNDKSSQADNLGNGQQQGIGAKDILADAEMMLSKSEDELMYQGLFTVKTAEKWLKQSMHMPDPCMLFGQFWFENELCILFADTNLGKSILAVQIGNSISRNEPVRGFILQAPKQPVLYFDFELTAKQFEARYSNNFNQHYPFDPNFIRVEINADAEIPENKTFEEYLYKSIEATVKSTGAKVLIIDNLTYLRNETEKASDALPLMKQLKALKTAHSLSILVLSHTPKRDSSRPLTKNDLQGSKMLINFCDSAFAIGESQADKSLRYLKQIKQRNTEQLYGGDNVIVCQITKPFNFLQYEHVGREPESAHLKKEAGDEKETREAAVKELSSQGKSQRDIALQLGISVSTVNKYLRL